MTQMPRTIAAAALCAAFALLPIATALVPVGGGTPAAQTATCWPTSGAAGHIVDAQTYVWSASATIRCASQATGELIVTFDSGAQERVACAAGDGLDPICELQIVGEARRGDCMLVTARTTTQLQGEVASHNTFCIGEAAD